jgi:hypothetical protein
MNKILILLFLITTLSVKSQSIDKVIVDKTIEYIGDCVKPDEIKKTSNYESLDNDKTKYYTNFDKFDSIIKSDFINTYNSFTLPLIELKNDSESKYVVFIEILIEKNNEIFKKYFASEIIDKLNYKLKVKRNKEINQINKNDNPEYPLLLVIILLSIGLIVVVLKKQKTKEVKKEKKQEPNIYYRNPYEAEVERYKEQIKTLNLKVDHLESKLSDLNIQNNNELIVEISDIDSPEDLKPTSSIRYYLLAPIADKTFSDEHKSSVSEYGNSMFLFTISEKETHATFEFCGDTKVLSYVMDFPDESIERVCEYENSKTDYKSEIITTKPGEAELRGEKWIVTKPAKIKFQ